MIVSFEPKPWFQLKLNGSPKRFVFILNCYHSLSCSADKEKKEKGERERGDRKERVTSEGELSSYNIQILERTTHLSHPGSYRMLQPDVTTHPQVFHIRYKFWNANRSSVDWGTNNSNHGHAHRPRRN